MTNEIRILVQQAAYRAFGEAAVNEDPDRDGQRFTLNLRLPGQYYDEETGLHYNYYRDYDPKIGRYVTSDPAGLAGGVNTYLYVSANPLGGVDPLGLYEQDIHYYMTFFLAVTAGVNPTDARTIALATQYIDSNPLTAPVPPRTGDLAAILFAFHNAPQLKDYHFVLSDNSTGQTLTRFQNDTLTNSFNSPQLQAMLGYALMDPKSDGTVCFSSLGKHAAQLQFFGEYLHAFQDTFSHRGQDNIPYNAVLDLGLGEYGIGHGLDGHQPDYTYNATVTGELLGNGNWNNRAARTLEMEHEVYNTILTYFGDPARAKPWDQILPIVQAFNAIPESEQSLGIGPYLGPTWAANSTKVRYLNGALIDLGFTGLNLTVANAYSNTEAQSNRDNSFGHLDPAAYPNAILR